MMKIIKYSEKSYWINNIIINYNTYNNKQVKMIWKRQKQ